MRWGSIPLALIALSVAAQTQGDTAVCPEATTQMQINECAGRTFQEADKNLNKIYGEAVAKVTGNAKDKLRKAQRAWIGYRDSACDAEAALYEGGSMAPATRAFCLDRVTRARTDELINTYKLGKSKAQ